MMHSVLKDKRILITGGAGFIGSHLCDFFLEKNEVVCFDNLATGNIDNISHLFPKSQFTFVEADLTSLDDCQEHTKNIDIIFHQAAIGSVPRSIDNPLYTHDNNVNGFINLLEAAKRNGVNRVIYASSSSVYGDHPALPKVEDQIGEPLSPYAVSKLTCEKYANVYAHLYNMNIIGLRYFNVFGKNQNPNGAYAAVIPKFISAFLNNEDVTVYGNGEQSRDFTHVANVVRANDLAAIYRQQSGDHEIFNIAYGSSMSLNEVINQIATAVETSTGIKSTSKVNYGSTRDGDIQHSHASIEKAKNLLQYVPFMDCASGINQLVAHLSSGT